MEKELIKIIEIDKNTNIVYIIDTMLHILNKYKKVKIEMYEVNEK